MLVLVTLGAFCRSFPCAEVGTDICDVAVSSLGSAGTFDLSDSSEDDGVEVLC